MAVQFILGRSGTGKTSYCTGAIVEALLDSDNSQALVLLVPEQATYQAERAILSDERIKGYSRLSVLSFERLGFLLFGKNIAARQMSQTAKQMIIQRILRQSRDKLKVFGASADSAGLAKKMAQTVVELQRYNKGPGDIDELLRSLQKENAHNAASLKFADIGLIYGEYLKFIEEKFVNPDMQLTQAAEAVRQSSLLKAAKVWVDGFAGFTTQELMMLAELLKAAEDAQIALCLDPSKIDLKNPDTKKLEPNSVFGPTERTYAELAEIIKKCKLTPAEPIILAEPRRFANSPELAEIEQGLFEPNYSANINSNKNVRIAAASNPRAEVEYAARQILRLVKKEALRFRDIAVVVSDIEGYQHYVRAVFGDYRIPFFIDKRKSLQHHPLVRLISSALEVAASGFSTSEVLGYLKTDLVPIGRSDVDLLKNYCLAFGIDGDDWKTDKDWQFAEKEDGGFDEQQINKIRREARGPLLELCKNLRKEDGTGPKRFAKSIFELIDSLGVRAKLGQWSADELVEKGFESGGEHQQFFDKLVDIFDELVDIFGDERLSIADYVSVLNSAFSEMTLAFIPPRLDQVLVGSIERSRHPDLKAVFLIGASQRQFPVPVTYEDILTEEDRCAAEATEFRLADRDEEKLAARQYLAYIAFTRPSQFLFITYPLVNDKGEAAGASQFLADLKSLFANFTEDAISADEFSLEQVHSEIELADSLCVKLGKDAEPADEENYPGEADALLKWISNEKQFAKISELIRDAINYQTRACLDDDFVDAFFGREFACSVTRLSSFAACPYQHFARFVLGLEERQTFKFEPLDLGRFYHQVLDKLFKQIKAEKKEFAKLSAEQLKKLLNDVTARMLINDSFISNFASRSRHNRYIITSAIERLEDFAAALSKMAQAGQFRPTASEVFFGKKNEGLGECKISLSKGRRLCLKGKIDRLDVVKTNGQDAALVFDYKRSEKNINWSKLYYGLDMQLPVYLLAVQNKKIAGTGALKAAGAFYVPVEVNPEPAKLGELKKKEEKFNYKAKGLFDGEFFRQLDAKTGSAWSKFYNFYIAKAGSQYGNYRISGALRPDDFEGLLGFTKKKIVQLAEEILSGEIDVRPYRLNRQCPCSYCKYKPVCRFDWQINDYKFLEPASKLEILQNTGMADDE